MFEELFIFRPTPEGIWNRYRIACFTWYYYSTCYLKWSMFWSLDYFLLFYWFGCTRLNPLWKILEKNITDSWISLKSKLLCFPFFQTFVCFISNGAFPSIVTYSCLPYGNTVYHWSATLHAMANPLMAFFAFFVPCRKIIWWEEYIHK